MPEGPEVKTVARTLAEQLIGKRLGGLWYSQLPLRRPCNYHQMQSLEHQTIDNVSCYGKVLFIHIADQPVLYVQLGMTGQLKVEAKNSPPPAHTHVRWELQDTASELRYVDPRRFGMFDICSTEIRDHIIGRLGPDPFLLEKSEIPPLIKVMTKSNRSIKEVLLDQAVIAGVGNIYASEALFLARINPARRASQIAKAEYELLIDAIVDVMKIAYQNSGTSFSNYVDGTGKKGSNLAFLKVFQRDGQPCPSCQHMIERIKQSGRSTFFCAQCQK